MPCLSEKGGSEKGGTKREGGYDGPMGIYPYLAGTLFSKVPESDDRYPTWTLQVPEYIPGPGGYLAGAGCSTRGPADSAKVIPVPVMHPCDGYCHAPVPVTRGYVPLGYLSTRTLIAIPISVNNKTVQVLLNQRFFQLCGSKNGNHVMM